MNKADFLVYMEALCRPAATLISMVPNDKLDWRPGDNYMPMGRLLWHLTASLGINARGLVTGEWPKHDGPPDPNKWPSVDPKRALELLEESKQTIRTVLDGVSEEDFLNRHVAPPFKTISGKLEYLMIFFMQHFITHKVQLFFYLKQLGLPVGTQQLYRG